MYYRISILSNALTHLTKTLKEKNKIVQIFAGRSWAPSGHSRRKVSKDLPYLIFKEELIRRVALNKQWRPLSGKGTVKVFMDLKPTLEWLGAQEVPDLPVTSVTFLTEGFEINGTKDKYQVVLKYREASEDYVRRDCYDIMKHHIDALSFKARVLDLSGIFLQTDVNRKTNLLEKVSDDKKKMVELAERFFNEMITIDGQQKKVICLKGYELGTRNALILKEYDRL